MKDVNIALDVLREQNEIINSPLAEAHRHGEDFEDLNP